MKDIRGQVVPANWFQVIMGREGLRACSLEEG